MTLSANFFGRTTTYRIAGHNSFEISLPSGSRVQLRITHSTGPKGGESDNSMMALWQFAHKVRNGDFDSDPDYYTIDDLQPIYGDEVWFGSVIGGFKVTVSTATTPRDLIMPITEFGWRIVDELTIDDTNTPPHEWLNKMRPASTPPDDLSTFLVSSPDGLPTHSDASTINITDVDGSVTTMDTFDDIMSPVWQYGNANPTYQTLDFSAARINSMRTFWEYFPYVMVYIPQDWYNANIDFLASTDADRDISIEFKTYQTFLDSTDSDVARATHLKMSDGVDQTGNSFLPPSTLKINPRPNPTVQLFRLFTMQDMDIRSHPEAQKEAPVAAMVPIEEAHTNTQMYWHQVGAQRYKQTKAERETHQVDYYLDPAHIQDLDAIVAPHRTLDLLEDGDFELFEAGAGVIPNPGSSGGGGGGGSVRPASGLLYPRGDRC